MGAVALAACNLLDGSRGEGRDGRRRGAVGIIAKAERAEATLPAGVDSGAHVEEERVRVAQANAHDVETRGG